MDKMNDILKWMLMGYPWLMMVNEYWRLDEFIVTKKSELTIIRSSHSSPATMSDNATEARLRLTHLCRIVVGGHLAGESVEGVLYKNCITL